MHELLSVTLLTLQVGLTATALIFVPGVALGWCLARKRFPGKRLVETLVALPMVLPPVAVGYLLLLVFRRDAPLGELAAGLGLPVILTWRGAALAAAVMSLPLLVLGAQQGFHAVPTRLEQVGATLGATPWRVFWRVTWPLARKGVLHGTVFAFARAIGEFGATAVVAGRIPGETETLALAIHDRIERFDDAGALLFAGVSFVLAIAASYGAYRFLRSERP